MTDTEAEYEFEVSVVMPCLNEEQTVGTCIRKALETINDSLHRCAKATTW